MEINRQMTAELYVRGLLNLMFTQSKMMVTCMQMTDGPVDRLTKDTILKAAEQLVVLSVKAHDALQEAYDHGETQV